MRYNPYGVKMIIAPPRKSYRKQMLRDGSLRLVDTGEEVPFGLSMVDVFEGLCWKSEQRARTEMARRLFE